MGSKDITTPIYQFLHPEGSGCCTSSTWSEAKNWQNDKYFLDNAKITSTPIYIYKYNVYRTMYKSCSICLCIFMFTDLEDFGMSPRVVDIGDLYRNMCVPFYYYNVANFWIDKTIAADARKMNKDSFIILIYLQIVQMESQYVKFEKLDWSLLVLLLVNKSLLPISVQKLSLNTVITKEIVADFSVPKLLYFSNIANTIYKADVVCFIML